MTLAKVYPDLPTPTLYPHQPEAVDAMFDKAWYLLADDMGLGKTYEVGAEISQWIGVNRPLAPSFLITAPKSAMSAWEDMLALLFPGWPVLAVTSPTRAQIATFDYGFLIINHDALRLSHELLSVRVWDYVVADEVHAFKNRKAKRTKALKKIRAMHKRALSGTPMINRPDELWSILHWLNAKEYRSYWRFFNEYIKWKDSGYGYKIVIGPKNTDKLNRELQPFMLRRLKQEVLKDLPDKYYTHLRIDMSPEQARSYAEMKKHSHAWLEQQPNDELLIAPTVLAQLTRLRQFASASCELTYDDGEGHVQMREPSNKLDALADIVEDLDGLPVVVFSQFRQLIELAAHRFPDAISLTGKTPQAARKPLIDAFQRGEYPMFLSTIQAGGIGITLTRASTVVFLDRAWSPALNSQAEDRLHRIGQDNAVQVIVLQSKGTVDLTVERKLETKREWFQQVIEGKL